MAFKLYWVLSTWKLLQDQPFKWLHYILPFRFAIGHSPPVSLVKEYNYYGQQFTTLKDCISMSSLQRDVIMLLSPGQWHVSRSVSWDLWEGNHKHDGWYYSCQLGFWIHLENGSHVSTGYNRKSSLGYTYFRVLLYCPRSKYLACLSKHYFGPLWNSNQNTKRIYLFRTW